MAIGARREEPSLRAQRFLFRRRAFLRRFELVNLTANPSAWVELEGRRGSALSHSSRPAEAAVVPQEPLRARDAHKLFTRTSVWHSHTESTQGQGRTARIMAELAGSVSTNGVER